MNSKPGNGRGDQADTLRKLMQERAAVDAESTRTKRIAALAGAGSGAQVITFASGKGGVGKSCLVANLGAALARSGFRVLLVDGDFGLANLDILLGVQAGVTFEDVLDGNAKIQDAVLGVEPNLWLLPAGAGLQELRQADPATRGRMIALFERCPWEMDFILVDAGAGIQDNVLSLHHPAYESIVVMTPEPTSLTDAYGLVKLLKRRCGIGHFSVIVNQVTDVRDGRAAFQRLRDVADKFLSVQFDYLGHLPRDEKITQAVMKRKILLDLDPGAPAVPCLELLAKRLSSKSTGKTAVARNHDPGQRPSRLTVRFEASGLGPDGRFEEEPAPSKAPGNTAKFWRTLLGEVKA